MAQLYGLHSHNFRSTSNEELITVFRTKTMAYRSGSWITGATVTENKDAFMASLADKVFLDNDTDLTREYNGVDWNNTEDVHHTPISKLLISSSTRLFKFNTKINNGGTSVLDFPSRVFYSNPPDSGFISWGLEYGSDLTTTAGSATVTSATAKFQLKKIKVGDPFFINESSVGNYRARPYIVQSVDSETQITLTENITYTSTSDVYWVGSNWFNVGADDGDEGMGMTIASNEIILLKNNSIHRYNILGEELRQIKDFPGTTSPRSAISWGGYAWWFHPSGIFRTSGGTAEKVSNAVEDIITGMSTSNYSSVVGFVDQVRDEVGWFLGDVTLRDGDTISKCAIVLNLDTDTWEPRSYDKNIKVSANWLRSSIPETYFGDDSSGVYKLNTGTDFNGSAISFGLELQPIFPEGEDAVVLFNRIRSYIDNGPDVQLYYKLIYKPRYGVEGIWDSDDDWKSLKGSQVGPRVDWYFPTDARASGVQLKVVESGGDESFLLEKLTLYYSEAANF